MAIQLQRRRFTVDEYYKMADIGILTEDDPIELIDGEILVMAPHSPRHFSSDLRLTNRVLLCLLLSDRTVVSIHNPLRIDVYNEPMPDIALLHPRKDFYAAGHPTPTTTFLVIEVADSTLSYERHIKVPLYARAGIPEVWVVDLVARRVEVYRSPSPEGYRDIRIANPGDRLTPVAFPDVSLAVEEMLA